MMGKGAVFSRLSKLVVVIGAVTAVITGCTALRSEPFPTIQASQPATGIRELDEIIATVLRRDTDKLRSLIRFTTAKCTYAVGLGGPPKCLNGEREGTPVEVLPFLGHEGHFIRKDDIQSWDGVGAMRLYAVYQVSGTAYSEQDYPVGEYAIVFVGGEQDTTNVTLQVREGRIVRIDESEEFPPRIRQADVVRFLVPPLKASP